MLELVFLCTETIYCDLFYKGKKNTLFLNLKRFYFFCLSDYLMLVIQFSPTLYIVVLCAFCLTRNENLVTAFVQ